MSDRDEFCRRHRIPYWPNRDELSLTGALADVRRPELTTDDWEAGRIQGGLLTLSGSNGCGKTSWALELARRIVTARGWDREGAIAWVEERTLIKEEEQRRDAPNGPREVMADYGLVTVHLRRPAHGAQFVLGARAPILVIDDLGSCQGIRWRRDLGLELARDLIDIRQRRGGRWTILTTTRTIKSGDGALDTESGHLASRIRSGLICTLPDVDHRGPRINDTATKQGEEPCSSTSSG